MGKRRHRKFCKRTWETRIFPWKNSELIFFSSGGSCHLCLQTGHCKKHDVYADASQINFGETELEHLNIYKSIFVKQNLDIWTFANPFLCNGIWADLKGLHLLKLLRTRWMERRGDRFRNHQHLNILWWSWEMKKSTNSSHIFSCPGQLNNWHCLSLGPLVPWSQLTMPREHQRVTLDTSRH